MPVGTLTEKDSVFVLSQHLPAFLELESISIRGSKLWENLSYAKPLKCGYVSVLRTSLICSISVSLWIALFRKKFCKQPATIPHVHGSAVFLTTYAHTHNAIRMIVHQFNKMTDWGEFNGLSIVVGQRECYRETTSFNFKGDFPLITCAFWVGNSADPLCWSIDCSCNFYRNKKIQRQHSRNKTTFIFQSVGSDHLKLQKVRKNATSMVMFLLRECPISILRYCKIWNLWNDRLIVKFQRWFP